MQDIPLSVLRPLFVSLEALRQLAIDESAALRTVMQGANEANIAALHEVHLDELDTVQAVLARAALIARKYPALAQDDGQATVPRRV